jgi:hypothetical protein
MKRKRAEQRQALLDQAAVLIDQLLDWQEQTPQPNLTQIEEIVLKLRKQLGEQLALAVIEQQEAKRPAPGPLCAQCQREMHYKAQKDNTVESRVGTLPLQRGYYYCETCRTGLFPPRPSTGNVGPPLECAARQTSRVVERFGAVCASGSNLESGRTGCDVG